MKDSGEITRLLESLRDGDRDAYDKLFSLVYDHLRQRAHRQLGRVSNGQTLNTTGLVHEAYLRLVGIDGGGNWQDRGHFFAVASTAMRHILVDHARRRGAAKRGSAAVRVPLAMARVPVEEAADHLLSLHEALDRLGELDERLARVVELRFFGGLSVDETAQTLGVSPRTVKRDWRVARAFLYRELDELRTDAQER